MDTSASAAAARSRRRAQPVARGRHELLQPRLLDRREPLVHEPHGLGVHVDAQDLVALARHDGRERRAELPESDDGDPHQLSGATAVTSRCQPKRRSNARKRRSGIQRKYGSFTYRYST